MTLKPFQADKCGAAICTLLQNKLADALEAGATGVEGDTFYPPPPVHFAYGELAAGFRVDGPLLWVSDGPQVPLDHGAAPGWYPVSCTFQVSVTWRYEAGDIALIPKHRSRYAEAVRSVIDAEATTGFANDNGMLGGYAYAIAPVRLEPGEFQAKATTDEVVAEITVYGGVYR